MAMTNKTNKAKVLLAIPVFNEEEHLDAVLDQVTRYIINVLVVDDGSTDDSKLILARRQDVCVISHRKNCGYGQAIIHALHFAVDCGFDWIITMDCDLQHEPAQIPDFLAALCCDDADIISGSRYLPDCREQNCAPSDRQRINRIVTKTINDKLNLALTDSFCGFKACRVRSVEKLDLTEVGYAFPLEFWVQTAHHGLQIREIPVHLIYNNPNRCFGGLLDDARMRLHHYMEVFDAARGKVGL